MTIVTPGNYPTGPAIINPSQTYGVGPYPQPYGVPPMAQPPTTTVPSLPQRDHPPYLPSYSPPGK